MRRRCKDGENTVQNQTGELQPADSVVVCIELIIGDLLAPDHEILSGFIHRTARLRIPN
jgi:hypothetical protein